MLPEAPLALQGCEVDLRRRLVRWAEGRTTTLTAREVDLLAYLARHPDRTITREELLVEVWGYSADMVTRTVDNTVRRLRTKVEATPREPRHVLTVFGEGYRFAPLVAAAPELPSGGVALVEGRVEDLPTLQARDPAGAERLLQAVQTALDEVVEAHRGVVVRRGPQLLVAFGEPHGAVSAALALQVALAGRDGAQPDVTRRVAVGVGFGSGQPLGDDYEGQVRERVASLSRLAHGGQVLIGPEVWRAVTPLRALGAVSTPLGRFVLQEGVEAAPVVAVAVQALADRRFPPPRSTEARRTNLDDEVTSFVGRRAHLARLRGAFAREHRLVTLRGPAGAGKTRLSRRYGLSRVDALSSEGGGVWFADLAEATTEEGVVAAVAAALGVPLDPEGAVEADRDQVGRALRARGRTLVILDNAEQVVDRLAPSLSAWLGAASAVRFLVTSRRPVDLAEEQVLDLPPLETDEAVALFVDRARAVDLELELEAADIEAIHQIAERLDHNPLALELAAVRVRLLPPQVLAERLDERFRALGRGPRDGPERHATLQQAIAWSWDLLEDWARDAFSQLGVFRGGFDVHAAARVVQLPTGAPPLPVVLHSLQERSLLQRIEPVGLPDQVRFQLLLSLQDWVSLRLQDRPDAEHVRARHRAWAAELGAELIAGLDSSAGLQAARRLQLELGNLTAAHAGALEHDAPRACSLAVALDAAMAPRGPYEDHLHLLDQTLDHASDGPPEGLVRVYLARARAHEVRGDVARVEADLAAAAALAHRAGPGVLADVQLERARWFGGRGRVSDARRLLDVALFLGGEPARSARVLGAQARLAASSGDLAEALRVGIEAAEALAAADAQRSEAALRVELAGWASASGRLDEATGLHRRALRLARRLEDLRLEGRVLSWLGGLYAEVGQHGLAEDHLALAQDLQRRVGDRRRLAICRGHLAVVRAEQGQLDRSEALLEQALAVLDEGDQARLQGWYRSWLASVLLRQGHEQRAARTMREALQRLEESGDARLLGRALTRSVPMLVHFSRQAEAERVLSRADELLTRVGDHSGLDAVTWLRASRLGRAPAPLPADARLDARWVANGAPVAQG